MAGQIVRTWRVGAWKKSTYSNKWLLIPHSYHHLSLGVPFPPPRHLFQQYKEPFPKTTLTWALWKSWKQCETVVLPCRILQSPRVADCVCMKQRSFCSDGAEGKYPQIYCRMMKPELQRAPLACLTRMHSEGGWERTRVLDTDLKLSCKQVVFLTWTLLINCLKNSRGKRGPGFSISLW